MPKRLGKASSSRSQANASPIKLPPSPSPTDSEHEAQFQSMHQSPNRSCSINHTVHKTFLEPICDDCVVAEMGASSLHDDIDAAHSDRLIWDSDVKIEVNDSVPQPPPSVHRLAESAEEKRILESHVEVRVSDTSRPRSSLFPMLSQRTNLAHTPSNLSGGDADSESSAPSVPFRGRPRSRTRQIRRMAMDVSREDLRLRISSRWPSSQRQGMQLFKDELQKGRQKKTEPPSKPTEPPIRAIPQPEKTFMQRLTDAHGEKWSKAKGAVHELSRKMSRRSQSPRRATRPRDTLAFGRGAGTTHTDFRVRALETAAEDGRKPNRTPSHERPTTSNSIAPDSFYLHHSDPCHPAMKLPADNLVSAARPSASVSQETWGSHLERDLTTPRQQKHRPILDLKVIDSSAAFLNGNAKPLLDIPSCTHPSGSTSTTAVSTRTASRNWHSHPSTGSNPFSHKSYEYSSANSDEAETKRRLLTISTTPSIPATATSASFSLDSPHRQAQRLASIVTSSEFDNLDDHTVTVGTGDIERDMAMVGLTTNPWRGPSMNTDEVYEAVLARNNESRLPSAASGELRVASEESDPFTDQKQTTPLHATDKSAVSPPTAIRAPRSAQGTEEDCILPNTSFAARMTAATASPSPTPSPRTGSPTTHPQLALHALSTPFHASLAPHHHNRHPSPHSPSIASILQNAAATPPRPQSAPHPYTTIAHVDPHATPPEAPAHFALAASPTSLFSCVWVRETCSGRDCARVVGWRVRSCLCGGSVRVADPVADRDRNVDMRMDQDGDHKAEKKGDKEGGAGALELEAQCRSGAPVVRYVAGSELCAGCEAKTLKTADEDESEKCVVGAEGSALVKTEEE